MYFLVASLSLFTAFLLPKAGCVLDFLGSRFFLPIVADWLECLDALSTFLEPGDDDTTRKLLKLAHIVFPGWITGVHGSYYHVHPPGNAFWSQRYAAGPGINAWLPPLLGVAGLVYMGLRMFRCTGWQPWSRTVVRAARAGFSLLSSHSKDAEEVCLWLIATCGETLVDLIAFSLWSAARVVALVVYLGDELLRHLVSLISHGRALILSTFHAVLSLLEAGPAPVDNPPNCMDQDNPSTHPPDITALGCIQMPQEGAAQGTSVRAFTQSDFASPVLSLSSPSERSNYRCRCWHCSPSYRDSFHPGLRKRIDSRIGKWPVGG